MGKVSAKSLFSSTTQSLQKSSHIGLNIKTFHRTNILKNTKTNVFGLLKPSSGFYNFSIIDKL